jgi:hypothetical protein
VYTLHPFKSERYPTGFPVGYQLDSVLARVETTTYIFILFILVWKRTSRDLCRFNGHYPGPWLGWDFNCVLSHSQPLVCCPQFINPLWTVAWDTLVGLIQCSPGRGLEIATRRLPQGWEDVTVAGLLSSACR